MNSSVGNEHHLSPYQSIHWCQSGVKKLNSEWIFIILPPPNSIGNYCFHNCASAGQLHEGKEAQTNLCTSKRQVYISCVEKQVSLCIEIKCVHHIQTFRTILMETVEVWRLFLWSSLRGRRVCMYVPRTGWANLDKATIAHRFQWQTRSKSEGGNRLRLM